MSGRSRKTIKGISFVLILCLLVNFLTVVLQEKWVEPESTGDTYIAEGFYQLDKNTIELAILGNSQAIRGFSGMRFLEKFGISSYCTASGAQPMVCTYYYASRMLKTQHMKAAVIEVGSLFESVTKPMIRRVLDPAPFSVDKMWLLWNYTKMIHRTQNLHTVSRHFWTLVFPVVQFHERWEQLTEDDFTWDEAEQFVFRGNTSRNTVKKVSLHLITENTDTDDKTEFKSRQIYYFRRLVELLKKEGIKVILVKTPKTGWSAGQSRLVQETADEYGVPFLDFNKEKLFEDAGFNMDEDFADKEHLNINGAEKLTDYIGSYLKKNVTFTECKITEKDRKELELYHRQRTEM